MVRNHSYGVCSFLLREKEFRELQLLLWRICGVLFKDKNLLGGEQILSELIPIWKVAKVTFAELLLLKVPIYHNINFSVNI